jgi:phosphoglycolate phosphatase
MDISYIDAVFFDFDGVILDSTTIKTRTFQEMYSPFGDEIVEKVLNHHLQYGGISRVEKIDYYHREFLNRPLSEEALDALCQKFSENVKDAVVNADWIPGAEEFLKEYHKKIKLYVVSGTPESELIEIVEKRNMTGYFQTIMGSPVKKPVHVRYHLEKSKLKAGRCFFIGDALTDFNAAKETGLHFIGIQGDITFPEGTKVLPDCSNLASTIEEFR